MDRDKLKAAIEADVISADQAARLEAMFTRKEGEEAEAEPLRFLSNLNDVFLSIGLVILFVGLGAGLSISIFTSGTVRFEHFAPVIFGLLAAIAWGLSEYFCARRKLLLPSIILAIIWSVCVGVAAYFLLVWNVFQEHGGEIASSVFTGSEPSDSFFEDLATQSRTSAILGILVATGAALAYYIRFRLPFSQFLMMITLSLIAFILMPGYETLVAMGVVSLLLAIFFDARDPHRSSRLSDNAFWLHVAAAPQLVYGIRGIVEGSVPEGSAMVHVALVSVLAVLTILSLALNRRALIISGLVTFGWAIWNLFQAFGDSILMKFAAPFLLIGAIVVLLGAGWKTARKILLAGMPSTGLLGRVFPKEV